MLLYTLAAFCVGIVVGMTGVGGGSLMTPILILFFGVQPLIAVATDLVFAAATKCTGAINYARQKLVDWRIVINMALGGVPGSLLMLFFIRNTSLNPNDLIEKILGCALLITAVVLFLRPYIQKKAGSLFAKLKYVNLWRGVILALLSFGLGMLVTLSSVGAGAISLAILMLLYPKHKISVLVGTDLSYTVLLLIVGAGGYIQLGLVDFSLLGLLLLGSIPGVLLGSMWNHVIPEKQLRAIIGVVFIVLGGWFIFSSL